MESSDDNLAFLVETMTSSLQVIKQAMPEPDAGMNAKVRLLPLRLCQNNTVKVQPEDRPERLQSCTKMPKYLIELNAVDCVPSLAILAEAMPALGMK